MALDLSSVNDTSFGDPYSNTMYNSVFLSSDVISFPGTNDILFYISEVGHLILANFFVENSNGSYILKKLPSVKFPQTTSGVPINVYSDKGYSNQEDCLFSTSTNGCSSLFDLSTPTKFGCVDLDAQLSSSAADRTNVCYSQTGVQWTTPNSSSTTTTTTTTLLINSDVEQAVAATTPRRQCENDSKSLHRNEVDNESPSTTRSKFLGQIVSELLEKSKTRINSSESDEIIIHGHNLSELERFVNHFRQFRLRLGLSQVQLSSQLAKHYNNKAIFSQTLLSRFEKLSITVRSAYRLLPYLKRWIAHAEQKQCSKIVTEKLPVFHCSIPVRAVGNARVKMLARLGQSHSSDNNDNNAENPTVLALVTKQVKNNNDDGDNHDVSSTPSVSENLS
uniref:POU-specific domain-containing protein n=1 Tax=Trichobilharzia regenti TaxID=157069 RepID=A0AA85J2C2_TRIRE